MMRNRELLIPLNPSLAFFLTHMLNDARQILPSSCRENIESLVSLNDDKTEKKYFDITSMLSKDTSTLFHFYQTTQSSYQNFFPQWLSQSKEINKLSHSIHVTFEISRLILLLMQHGQMMWMIQEAYPLLQMGAEKNNLSRIADIMWYRSLIWICIHSIAVMFYFYFICANKMTINPLILYSSLHEYFKNKLHTTILTHCSHATTEQAQENYLLLSSVLSIFSIKKTENNRDWLSWFDDGCHYLLNKEEKNSPLLANRIKQINAISEMIKNRIHFCMSTYLARPIVKLGLLTWIFYTLLSPENYMADMTNTMSAPQVSYGVLPWFYHQSNSPSFFLEHSLLPFIYYMELQLWTWLLIPIVAGLLEMSVIKKISSHYIHANIENFKKSSMEIMQAIQDRYFLMYMPINSDRQVKNMNLIDSILLKTQVALEHPLVHSKRYQQILELSSFFQHMLYQITRMIYKCIKAIYFSGVVLTLFIMIQVIDKLPTHKCKRLQNAVNEWKNNSLQQRRLPKTSDSLMSFFATKQTDTMPKPSPAFRFRAPVL